MWCVKPGSALFTAAIAANSYRSGSLTGSGAIAAFAVGYMHLLPDSFVPCALLLVFFFVGSKATKWKAAVKASYEDTPAPNKKQGRNAEQVLATALPGALISVVMALNFLEASSLMASLYGIYATNLADTLSSEIGVMSTDEPFSILPPFKRVPRGTNGGVSTLGLLAAIVGGSIIGAIAAISGSMQMVIPSIVCGLLGSLLDSVLGATCQTSCVNEKGRIIVHGDEGKGKSIEGILGFALLSNTGVNLVSSLIVSASLFLYQYPW